MDLARQHAAGRGVLRLRQRPTARSDRRTVSADAGLLRRDGFQCLLRPDAPLPLLWLRYLDQVLDDDEAITCLQDWMGYLLTSDTAQQKILFMEGPPRSGKGTWARIMAALLGKQSVAGPTMSQLSEHFGLEPLITASLALISDARIGGRTDKSTIAERLLSISGEDTLTVGRKHILAWTGKLPTRIAILTNELPALGKAPAPWSGGLSCWCSRTASTDARISTLPGSSWPSCRES